MSELLEWKTAAAYVRGVVVKPFILRTAKKQSILYYYPPFAQRIGEVFILLYVFFVRSTISQQPEGRFTPNFACGRILLALVSSPFLGQRPPGGGQKEGKRHGGGLIRA